MAETITIDGRGNSIQEAVNEMWARMKPLEQRGFHPISEVEIVDAKKNELLESYDVTDPVFQGRLKPVLDLDDGAKAVIRPPHAPERKEHYAFISRIRLEA